MIVKESVIMSIYKGLFWVRSPKERDIITIRFESDKNGVLHDTALTPKDINHKRQWAKLSHIVTGTVPYNYYPRGRVELRRGKALIFCSPYICTDILKEYVIEHFGLTEENGITDVTLKADGSGHYRCFKSD